LPAWGKPTGQGFPGIPVYGTSTNLTSSNVSPNHWRVNSTYLSTKRYDSNYFLNAIPPGIIPAQILQSSVTGNYFTSGGTEDHGYYWYEYDAATAGTLFSITSPASLTGRKVILIVSGADVSLQGNINRTVGSGFFMLITSGKIIVDPGVGGVPPQSGPNLEGIFISDGQFQTGIAATQLWVRGSIASYGGVSLQRNLGDVANLTTASELFEYAPDLEFLFPQKIGSNTMSWQEVAP
jgi:hypothetical protein